MLVISAFVHNATAFDNRLYLDGKGELSAGTACNRDIVWSVGGTASWIGRGWKSGILMGFGYSRIFGETKTTHETIYTHEYVPGYENTENITMDALDAIIALTTGGSGDALLYIGPTLSILTTEANFTAPVAWVFSPTLGLKIDGDSAGNGVFFLGTWRKSVSRDVDTFGY